MKRKAIKGLVALAAVVCLCMFFSGTIKTLSTAKVQFVTARQGKLEEQIKLHGTLVFSQTEDVVVAGIPSDVSVVVRRVRAVKGRQVKEGDVLLEAEIVGKEEKLDQLRAEYDTAQGELMQLERKNSALRMTRADEQWIEAYDALNAAKSAMRDARMALEVRARLLGVELTDGKAPKGTKDKELSALQEAYEQAREEETAAQRRYDNANRLGVNESVIEYITQSRALSEKMEKAEEGITELNVLSETVSSVCAEHDGYVVDVSVKAGDSLSAQTVALVLSARKVKGALRADVSEIERPIEKKTSVTIERTNGRSVSASVTDTGVDADGKNYVDVELSDKEITNLGGAAGLMGDGIDMVASYRAGSSTTLLPVSAVRGTGEDRYVYIVNESQNGIGQRVMTVAKQNVKVLAEVGSTVSIQEDLGRQRVAYMEDRAIDEGSEVMAYVQ